MAISKHDLLAVYSAIVFVHHVDWTILAHVPDVLSVKRLHRMLCKAIRHGHASSEYMLTALQPTQ